ncbi:MAG: DNA (cytosine-5-)-methyltransferase [Bacteroidales bacterium]|nr:DNA (cytosine-5-)-methyltransferase [Bacteroidales bacterium]
MDHTQNIISIATGTGGLEAGLERAGIKLRVVSFVEIEAFIIANLVAAMETLQLDAAPIWADIKTFPAQRFHNKIHGITAGYPCQPFSNAGKREGEKDPRHIFPDILRTIKATNPIWCFFENVEGHITLGFDEVYNSLQNLGYNIEAGIFSAEEVGAPHRRKRLYILAIKMEYSNATTIERIFNGANATLSNLGSSSPVSNTNHNGSRTKPDNIQKETSKTERTAQREYRKRLWNEFGNGCNVPNSNSLRIDKSIQNSKSELTFENGIKFPAPRNSNQYEWEEPRTTKSGMGCTVNGYNFRIDLLRALGNGVVPQAAELAFTTLLKKFL